ncbi:ribonuclease H-like domain-containing protein [Tanacetum coccineum]
MLEFCRNKRIKQEYSNARTLQQNRVAERMNKTLIKAAGTMLADSLLSTTFWAEAVSTACYIFNRVRVTKPQNKTPYELLFGHKPIISYIRPFGCHVTILDTLNTPEILAFRIELDELAQKHLREVPKNKATSTTSVNSGSGPVNSQHADQDDSDMPELTIFNKPQKGIFVEASYDDEGMVYDFNNLPIEVAVSPIPTIRIHNIHPQIQILGDPKSSVQTRSRVHQHSGAHALIPEGYFPKTSHLNAVKRIFNDYGGANLDRKSIADLLTKAFDGPMFNFLVVNIEDEDDVKILPNKVGKLQRGRLWIEMVRSIMKKNSKSFENLTTSRQNLHGRESKTRFEVELDADEVILHNSSPKKGPKRSKVSALQQKSSQKTRNNPEKAASLAEIVRLQAQEEAENARKVEQQRQDALIAKRVQVELELSKTKKNMMAQVQEAANDIIANKEVEQSMRRRGCTKNTQRERDRRNRPMTQAKQREYMIKYLKIQGNKWKMGQLKKLKPDELEEEFDKCVEKVEKFIPMNSELEASKLKRTDESVKREEEFKVQQPILRYNIRKSLARKGLQKNKSEFARSDTEEDVEAYMDERVDEPYSEEFQMGSIPQGSAPAKIVKWQILKTCKKQTVVANSTTEAEYVAASSFYGQVLWIQNRTRDLWAYNLLAAGWKVNAARHKHTATGESNAARHKLTTAGQTEVFIGPTPMLPIFEQLALMGPKKKDTQVPQSSVPSDSAADEAVYKELDDSLMRAATTASSLEAEQSIAGCLAWMLLIDLCEVYLPVPVMAISVISISSDSSEDSVGTPAGRVILFGTIPTTIPDTTPVITPPHVPDAIGLFINLIHSSLDLPSTSAGPSCKRRRSPMTLAPALPPVSGLYLCPSSDLIAHRPKGVSDEPHLEQDIDSEIQAEIDECFAYAKRVKTGIEGPGLSHQFEGYHHLMPEDTLEPAHEGVVKCTYETLGDLVQRFHDHTEAIPVHRIQAIEGVQREQGHRIVGAESAVTVLTKRVAELKRDNMRLRGTASVKSQRVD